jgi:hypothetical protein
MLQMESLDPRLIGGDADPVLLDRVGRVDRWAALGGST